MSEKVVTGHEGQETQTVPWLKKGEKEAPGVIPQPAQLYLLERSWDKG